MSQTSNNFEIRKINLEDIDSLVKIHCDSFKDSFLTKLGTSFLKLYYNSVLKNKNSILVGHYAKNDLIGFAVGSKISKNFNKKLILNNLIPFFFYSIIILLKNPTFLFRLFKNLEKKPIKDDNGNYAELFSIAVNPKFSRKGIGKKLLLKFEELVYLSGSRLVALTTDLDNNKNVLKFYYNNKYKVYYKFVTYPNRKMVKLIKKL